MSYVSDRTPLFIDKTTSLIQDGRYDHAIQVLYEAIDIESNHSLYNNLAVAYYMLSDYKNADSSIEIAISLDKNNPDYHFFSGRIKLRLGLIDAAYKKYLRVLELDSTFPGLHVSIAEILISYNYIDLAKESLNKSLVLSDSLDKVYMNLGRIGLRQFKYVESRNFFLKALEYNNHCCQSLNGLGFVSMALEDFCQAKKYFQMVNDIDKGNFDALIGLDAVKSNQLNNKNQCDQ